MKASSFIAIVWLCWVPAACARHETPSAEDTEHLPAALESAEPTPSEAEPSDSAAGEPTPSEESPEDPPSAGVSVDPPAASSERDSSQAPSAGVQDRPKATASVPPRPAPPPSQAAPSSVSKQAAPASESAPVVKGYTGANPCTAKKFRFSSVKAACERGGRDEAKAMMKSIVKKGKEKTGKRITCKSCHSETKQTYQLEDNAVSDFRSYSGG